MLVKFQDGEIEVEKDFLIRNSEYVERWLSSALTKDTSVLRLELFCNKGMWNQLIKK